MNRNSKLWKNERKLEWRNEIEKKEWVYKTSEQEIRKEWKTEQNKKE